MKAKTIIHLTGGLGNQLFQIAAARSRNVNELYVEPTLGKPRLNANGLPDVYDFEFAFDLPQIILRYPNANSVLMRKTSGFLLRQSVIPTRLERLHLIRYVTHQMASQILSFGLGQKVSITQATDNGFCHLPDLKRNEYLIGYFQSHVWADSLDKKDSFKQIRLKSQSPQLVGFLNEIQGKSCLLVHVRLGDYKNAPGFGIPGLAYYANSIKLLTDMVNFDAIVLFSNEPVEAINYVPARYRSKVVVAPDFSKSAAETLEAMRNMTAYVIANSSLSWWGAYLSYSENPLVICPSPWFRLNSEPFTLVPKEWIRLEGWLDELSE